MNDHSPAERGLVAPAGADQNEQSVRPANFTRHHYVWLARAARRIISDLNRDEPISAVMFVCQLADELSDNNRNFNKKLFLDNIFASEKDPNR